MKIIDIPIYRTSPSNFDLEFEHQKIAESKVDKIDLNHIGRLNYFKELLWYPWEYNDEIGYIRISLLINQIVGDLFIGNYQKIRRNFRKRKIKFEKNLFRIDIHKDNIDNNYVLEIKAQIIQSKNNDRLLKNRYIDFMPLLEVLKYIDWDKLIKENSAAPKSNIISQLNDMAERPNSRMYYLGEEVEHSSIDYYKNGVNIDDLLEKAKERENTNTSQLLTEKAKLFLKELYTKDKQKFIELMLTLKQNSD